MSAADKLKELRSEMKKAGIDGYLVPQTDEFQNEDVPDCWQRLGWFSGFDGSAGYAAVLGDKAVVVSDGRYDIQMQKQVDAKLYDIFVHEGRDYYKWLLNNVKDGAVIGYDPKLHTSMEIKNLGKALKKKGASLQAVDENLVDAIWAGQPDAPQGKVSVFDENVAGKTAAQKRQDIAAEIDGKGGAAFIMTMPDSIGWLLNIRGADVANTPLALSYAVLHADGNVDWYIDDVKMTPDVRKHVGNAVKICDPAQLEADIVALSKKAAGDGKPVMMDFDTAPVWFKNLIEDGGAEAQNLTDPVIAPRACKTPQEQDTIRDVHVRDGVAMAKFLHWIDEEAPKGKLTEQDVIDKLYDFRKQGANFVSNSFDTIAGWGENGAIVHYHVTKDSNTAIKGDGLLLVDSGGQYIDGGTTDITRTIAVGKPTPDMKADFTRVLKGHIAIARAKFPEGKTGADIDNLTRAPLWQDGKDYGHGTGHGVGCFSSVHESGIGLSSRSSQAFREGMFLSNEPGYYEEGKYGIRTENLVFVQKAGEMKAGNDNRALLAFETVSLAPIDTRLVETSLMNVEEITWLNDYHARVRDTLKPHMGGDKVLESWLDNACKPV